MSYVLTLSSPSIVRVPVAALRYCDGGIANIRNSAAMHAASVFPLEEQDAVVEKLLAIPKKKLGEETETDHIVWYPIGALPPLSQHPSKDPIPLLRIKHIRYDLWLI